MGGLNKGYYSRYDPSLLNMIKVGESAAMNRQCSRCLNFFNTIKLRRYHQQEEGPCKHPSRESSIKAG